MRIESKVRARAHHVLVCATYERLNDIGRKLFGDVKLVWRECHLSTRGPDVIALFVDARPVKVLRGVVASMEEPFRATILCTRAEFYRTHALVTEVKMTESWLGKHRVQVLFHVFKNRNIHLRPVKRLMEFLGGRGRVKNRENGKYFTGFILEDKPFRCVFHLGMDFTYMYVAPTETQIEQARRAFEEALERLKAERKRLGFSQPKFIGLTVREYVEKFELREFIAWLVEGLPRADQLRALLLS